MCEALTFLLDNIYIRFGSKLYRQIVHYSSQGIENVKNFHSDLYNWSLYPSLKHMSDSYNVLIIR